MLFSVDVLAKIIIHQYFLQSRCFFIFTDEQCDFHYDGDKPSVKIHLDGFSHAIFQNFGCQDVVIKTGNPLSTFKKFENLIRLHPERYNERKYLILPCYGERGENVTDIFGSTEVNFVSNLLVVLEREDGDFEIFSHRYVGERTKNEEILVDVWYSGNTSFWLGGNLYPNKLYNQEGRLLRMATFEYAPYSVMDNGDQLYGLELKTALTFALKYNMTPKILVNPDDYWGHVYENWTGTGLLGNILHDRADFGFAALCTWDWEYLFLDITKPVIRSGITSLVPAPKLIAGYYTPMYGFTIDIWKLVAVFFVLIMLVGIMIETCHRKNSWLDPDGNPKDSYGKIIGRTSFNIFKAFLLQSLSASDMPHRVVVAYDSSFAMVMMVPKYEKPIDTVQDLLDSGVLWGGTQDAWVRSIENTDQEKYDRVIKQFRALSEEDLREKSLTGAFGLVMERLPNENFAIAGYIKGDVIQNYYLMRSDLYWELEVMMTRKNSILLPMLDLFILRVFEAGLITYWQNEAVELTMDADVQKVVKNYYHHKPPRIGKLGWSQVEGAFALLIIGEALATLLFIMEIITCKLSKGQNKVNA